MSLKKENAMSRLRFSVLVLSLVLGIGYLSGCSNNGSAEKAGEQVDKATKEAKEKAGKAADTLLNDTTKDTTP
jgi:hypothetical protein